LREDIGKAFVLDQARRAGDAFQLLSGGFRRRRCGGALKTGSDDDLVLTLADALSVKRGVDNGGGGSKHSGAHESALHSIDLHDISRISVGARL